MDALYIWMVENGFDPALVAYIGGAIALLLIVKMFFFQKKNIAEIAEQEAEEKAQAEKKPESAASPEPDELERPANAQTPTADAGETKAEQSTAINATSETDKVVEGVEEVALEPSASAATSVEIEAQ
ncbi:MAG: hypothetical protein MJK13_01620, partial [Pseudomonadales bacterium]|nr:hypothetical protein [Pseudomonadales bacterium]